MKTILQYVTFVTLTILVPLSCSEDAMDKVDTNHNDPTEVPIKLILPQTIMSTVFGLSGNDLAWFSSVFVEQTTGVHGQLEDADKRRAINTTMLNNIWNEMFQTNIDLDYIIERGSEDGEEEGYWAAVGIAKFLKAYNFSLATDAWGSIPFSEAGQGSENRTPVFENEQAVYDGIFKLVNEAIGDMQKTSVGNPGNVDFIYGGDMDLWIKAAHGFKARCFNRLSNVGPESYTDSVIASSALSFADASESFIFNQFNTSATGQSPWYQEENDRGHHAVSKTIDDIMVSLNDPRRTLWFATIDDEIIPAPNGTAISDQAHNIYSRISFDYLTALSPMPVITYDEIKFLEAEALLRKGMTEEANTSYLTAVEEALLRAEVAETDIITYLEQGNVNVGSSNLTKQTILTQKYISFWLFQPIEAFSEYRRTGVPVLQNPLGLPPNRFPYGNDEVASNPNVPDITYQTKLWWAL
ncbi:MAG: SusD/RagB family nutrient-binding outer membrane lipoprotein [Bacteroidales bacterium]|nr:SusD/RagB family nutrient-binding outer membrane lipoprotein [Bacteroidales bacterium]